MPRWSPDSQTLYFLSDREKRGEAQLYRLPLAGGEAMALTDRRGGIGAFAPLGRWANNRPLHQRSRRPLRKSAASGARRRESLGRTLAVAAVHLLDRETGAIRTLDALGDRHVATFAASPDGARLAVTAWPSPELDNGAFPTPLHLD